MGDPPSEIRPVGASVMKPFSTYPEDRAKLLALCTKVENARAGDEIEDAADELADLVRAILEDEAVAIAADDRPGGFDGPTGAD